MTTIQSFPVRQQPSSINYTGADMFYIHFGLKSGINYMFAWSNRLRKIHAAMLIICVQSLFWLPIMNGDPKSITELPLTESNNSLTMIQLIDLDFVKRCTLSSSVPINNLNSYAFMQYLVILLCVCSYLLLVTSQWLYLAFFHALLLDPYQWFCWCRKIFICLVISSICNQLASVLGCRPIEILYDIRYISMIIVQIIGFFISLLFAFFLGVKYASVKRGN